MALNPRFRLLAVGCTNGDVHVFNVDANMTPNFSHTLSFHSRTAPMRGDEWNSGPVTDIKWSEDGYALALAQEEGGLSIWSVFGSSLMSTSADAAMAAAGPDTASAGIRKVTWGPCGYQLLALPAFVDAAAPHGLSRSIYQFHFIHSALTTNACLSNQFNVMLLGEDRLCLNPDTNSSTRLNGGDVDKLCDVQWQSIQIPPGYLKANWPIRCAALDPSGKFAVIAGASGFCHYSTVSRKWRVFGNVAQEKAFSCSGGLAWWRAYIITACRMVDGTEEIRFYPKSANLDNRHIACRKVVSKSVVLVNVFADYFIITTVNKKTLIYKMSEVERGVNAVHVDLELIWDVGMASYMMHPISTVSVTLVQLGHESAPSTSSSEPEALIVNVAGNLIVLSLSDNANTGESEFSDPALIATGVESYWGWTPTTSLQIADQVLSQALWLGCGGRGMQVWLPLHQSQTPQPPLEEGDHRGHSALGDDSSDGRGAPSSSSAPSTPANTSLPANDGSTEATPAEAAVRGDRDGAAAAAAAAAVAGGNADGGEEASDGTATAAIPGADTAAVSADDANRTATPAPTPAPAPAPEPTAVSTVPEPGALYKRIMLPFDLNVYPLSVLFEDAVVLGASHEAYRSSGSSTQVFPFCTLERKTQIYLHHILRQLLRRNQDSHALAIAKASSHLPYFSHVLELMLHEVLEDEAHRSTAATPVEDGQLPKVVAFLRNFDSRLDTIVHCARKTEVTKWKYFFSVVGDPKDLFHECVKFGKLDTAASCLVFLQTLESPTVSRKYALPLVHYALEKEQWGLAKDLNRFLKATASYESSPEKAAKAAFLSTDGVTPSNTSQVFASYALGLLEKGRIRALALFSANMGFPMVSWLYTIRVSHGSIKDVTAALEMATQEFNLAMAAAGSSATEKLQDELEFMLASIFEAQCFEWALLFCVVLRDTAAAHRVLDEVAADKSSPSGTFGLLNRFREATLSPAGEVHKQFVDSLTTTFKPATPMQKDLERERDPRRSTANASDSASDGGECGVM